MPYYEFVWTLTGNVAHLEEHGVTPDEAKEVVMNATSTSVNRHHSERIFAMGRTSAGRKLGVSYVHFDDVTVYVITAFDLE